MIDGHWIQNLLPAAIRDSELFGVFYWQWILIVALVFTGIVIDFAVRTAGRPAFRRVVTRFHSAADTENIRGTVAALGLFGAAVFWTITVRLLDLQGNTRDIVIAAIGIFTVFAGARFGWRFADLLGDVLSHQASRTDNKFDDILVPLLRKTAKVLLVALSIVYGAQTLKINIVPLVTGLGIGGLAFAFAAKDTIENFFGSIAVLVDTPFEVGDWVVVEDVEGTVEELGLRSTRIRTFYNSQVTVPNSTLVRATVDNLGRRAYRRWKTTIGVQYDTSPEKLLAFTEGIRELVRAHPYTRKDFYQVWCNDFADYSLNILLYIFFAVPDWSTELRERERFFVDVIRLADRLGVQFAFPTQTVHLYKEEHAPHASQYKIPAGAHDDAARNIGAAAALDITSGQDWQTEKPGPMTFPMGGQRERGKRERGGDG